MEDEAVYKQAVCDVKDLVDYVLGECNIFADKYHYDKEWVRDRFREEFNKKKSKLN